jgi:glycine cleavage system H protein
MRMSEIPSELRYTKDHEWVREDDDGSWIVGITDHAQTALGDLVFVELPEGGAVVSAGDTCAVVESVKAASDVYSPLTGEIVATNSALDDSPELVNSDPYGDGWLFSLRPEAPAEFDELLTSDDYERLLVELDD